MAGTFDPIVQQIRDRVDIVEFIGRYVPLKRAGASLKACCPFHQEKTPSFFVHPERQYYYCFGCGAKGDLFSFVMAYEGKTFPEAVRGLAEELGIEVNISAERREAVSQEEQKREQLSLINQVAKQFFIEQRQRPAGEAARQYLEKRGLLAETIEQFGLGYAPDDWTMLMEHLQEKGFSLELIREAGLIKTAEPSKRHYDRFRHRLMFPIFERSGRIVGFGGRILREDDKPKYLNSPESPLFRKSRLLYGVEHAHTHVRKSKTLILVEGYTDVITMHQYGFAQAVATLGTSLTEEHIKPLSRLTKRIILLFDGDKAGKRATERALALLLPQGFSVDTLHLPAGEDPDSFLRKHGREAFQQQLDEQAKPAFDVWLSRILEEANDDPVALREGTGKILEILREISDSILRDLYLQKTAERLGIEEASLRRQLIRIVPRRASVPAPPPDEAIPHPGDDAAVLIPDDPDAPAAPSAPPATAEAHREEKAMMELIKILIDNLQNPPLCTSIMESEIASHIEAPLWRDLWHDLLEDLREGADAAILIEGVLDALIPTPQSKQLMAESLLKSPPVDPETSSLMLSQIQQTFVRLKLERKIRQLTQEIRQASREDEQDVEALIREKIALQMQLPRYQAPVIEDNKQSSISFHNP